FYYNTADFLVPLPIFPLKKDHIRTAVLMWSLFFSDAHRAGLSGFSPICSFCAATGDAYFLRLARNFLPFSNILPQRISPRRHSPGEQAVHSALNGAAQSRAAVCGKTNSLTVRHTAGGSLLEHILSQLLPGIDMQLPFGLR